MADPAVQRFLLQRVLSLPTPVLRMLAGGGTAYRGGRTLDPRFQYLWNSFADAGLETLTPEDARLGWAELIETAAPDHPDAVRRETVLLDGPGGSLANRLHAPPDQDPTAPIIVFLHDGGGVAGGLDESDAIAAVLAQEARTAVLVPEYRLAPEHRFPAAFEDALAAVQWAREAGGRYGAAHDAVIVAGLSTGGGLAAAVCLELKRLGEPQPDRQLLVTPILDAVGEGQSMTTYADAWPLSVEALRWSMRHWLGSEGDPGDVRVSPLRAPELSGLAPAVVAIAGFDPVSDQGETYARRLEAAGVEVALRSFDALPHAFPQFGGLVPAAEAAWRKVARMARG